MSNVGPYGVTQNPDADAVIANALVGERVGGGPINDVPGAGPALLSTAPYEPLRRGKCIGKENTCEAYPIRGMDLCVFHRAQKERRELTNPA